MIIDCHNHVLATALPPGHERFIREMRSVGLRRRGLLPDDRAAVEADWAALGTVAAPVDPDVLIEHHRAAGVDRCVVLAVAPSEDTPYGQRGTVDLAGVTGLPGPPSIDRGNDAVAALCGTHPELLGMAAVNPRYRGVSAAVAELDRAVGQLGLTGLKLYPMYDGYAVDDPDLALPVLDRARELGIGVMVHMGTTPARGAPLELGRPLALDAVLRRLPGLRLLICHAGWPWVDEALAVAARHDEVYLDLSYMQGLLSEAELADLLVRAPRVGCPVARLCWGTDYPGGGMPQTLLPQVAAVGARLLPRRDLARLLGGNWARFAGVDWDEDAALDTVADRLPGWLAAAGRG